MKNRKKALLIALAIGDGHIAKRQKSTMYGEFMITHSIHQQEYITYKRDLLHSLVGGNLPKISEYTRKNTGYKELYFSKAHKYFRVIRKWLYKADKKVISRYILNKLTPEAIAIWYMDDGNLSKKKRDGRMRGYTLTLSTQVSKEENQVMIDYFEDVWNIKFFQIKKGNQYALCMGTAEARKFTKLVEPYVIPSMRYKVDMIYPPYPKM